MEIKKILTRENRVYFWSSGDLNTEFGLVKEKDIKKSKDRVFSNSKNEFKIFDASFTDKISKIKRGPAVILPKDIGLIITSTGINKNSKVLDAGTGSGVLSSYLSNFCKTVYSYEINREFYELAKKNFSDLNIKNIILKNKSVKDISEKDLDLIALDLPNPEIALESTYKSLKSGAFLVVYLPNITQVMDIVKKAFEFKLIKVVELIEREWHVEFQRVRPHSLMIGHTAFLIFFRKI